MDNENQAPQVPVSNWTLATAHARGNVLWSRARHRMGHHCRPQSRAEARMNTNGIFTRASDSTPRPSRGERAHAYVLCHTQRRAGE